jgi:D-glycero-D-manno-heptose 1,7-bisphosphate phosphatase
LPEIRAVFLDRDGVINRRRPDHVKCWDEFEFLPGVLEALAELRALGTPVVVITNQSAVGRGLLTAQGLREIHARMLRAIDAAGGHVSAVYACLHAPDDGCACRKPRPALFQRARVDLGIDLSASIMVGDSPTDVQAARAAGCRPIFVNDGGFPLDADVLGVNDLAEAVMLWRSAAVPALTPPC